MSLGLTLTSRDVGQAIRGSRQALRSVILGGTDPLIAAATVYVQLLKRLTKTPGQGNLYEVEFRFFGGRPRPLSGVPRVGGPHRASKPGDPPASDKGALSGGIGFTKSGTNRVGVGVSGPAVQYWEFLEFGTRFMKERPFVRLAIAIARQGAADAALTEMRARTLRILRARRKAAGR